MARKKTERKPKSVGEAVGFNNIFSNEKTDFILGLLLMAMAIYVIIAMISYFSTGQADQSLLESLRPGEWMNSDKVFTNYCGSIGAIIAHFLITVNFGLSAFMIPAFAILVALKLIKAYQKINLWKWFLSTMLIMIWCSVTFAKFLTPLMGDQVFNPGGNHGLFCVQRLEGIIGFPGLTALLLIVAIAFLTYLSAETIEVIRKALNPIGYISSKIKFTITNDHDSQDCDPGYMDNTIEEISEPDPVPSVIDLTPEPVMPKEELVKLEGNPRPLQKETPAENNDKLTIEVAESEEALKGCQIVSGTDLSTPIDPREPFVRYKFPSLDLLKKYEAGGKAQVDMEEIKTTMPTSYKSLTASVLPSKKSKRQ